MLFGDHGTIEGRYRTFDGEIFEFVILLQHLGLLLGLLGGLGLVLGLGIGHCGVDGGWRSRWFKEGESEALGGDALSQMMYARGLKLITSLGLNTFKQSGDVRKPHSYLGSIEKRMPIQTLSLPSNPPLGPARNHRLQTW